MPQELGRLTVAHCLEGEELANDSLSQGGQQVEQLGPKPCVGALLRRTGVDIIHLCGV
jgi:hypothetical protein